MIHERTEHPPSVDSIARSLADLGLPHPLLVEAARSAIGAGEPGAARSRAEEIAALLLRPVINATGVLLHTNLGRAPLGVDHDAGYSNLELDLLTGRRGERRRHAAALVATLVGAESALVVNNGAGALLLVCAALAAGKKVVVSRGELVEIGGGFRVHEVLAASGSELVEVGTTNRTHLGDYTAAATDAALVLKVHPSNYRIVGFTASVGIADLSSLGPPVVHDIGSGLLDARTPWLPGGPPPWVAGEPAARQSLEAGAALVTFSGDKMLGGPQAGIIAGRADLVDACARHPLYRALRPGSLVLGALQETALTYLARDGSAIPFWAMATASVESVRFRAAALGIGEVVDLVAVAGGGSLPGVEIPSAGVAVDGDHLAALRTARKPIVATVREGRTFLDLRTVDPRDDRVVREALVHAVGG